LIVSKQDRLANP